MGSRLSTSKLLILDGTVSYNLQYPVNNGHSFIRYYINLDKRPDRRHDIETELERINLKPYTRLPAIQHTQGALGCTKSHIECLKLGLASNADHILVFEDDFMFTTDAEIVHQVLQNVISTNYDVFLLGFCLDDAKDKLFETNHPMFKKATKSACTHGYMVKRSYASKLLFNFQLSASLLENTKEEPKYALDQYWKLLQVDDNFLCYVKGPLGFQRNGFSDIGKNMNFNLQTNVEMFQDM
jgi:GR25 family glycosyltransferase involved in LPS biosynthesis